MAPLDGKTIIVTGGGGGIGGAACRRLAQDSAQVAVFDMDLQGGQKGAHGIQGTGGAAARIAGWGRIDVLVNNAGWDIFKPFTRTVPAEWERLIAINLTGALHMHHAVLPGMVQRSPGRGCPAGCSAAPAASSTSRPMRRVAAPPARPSTPPARAVWWHCPRPWPANMPARASRSTCSAPARPTPPC